MMSIYNDEYSVRKIKKYLEKYHSDCQRTATWSKRSSEMILSNQSVIKELSFQARLSNLLMRSKTSFKDMIAKKHTTYFVNNRRQDRGKSRLHLECICPFLWTAHRFLPIELNRVRLSKILWNFNVFSFP